MYSWNNNSDASLLLLPLDVQFFDTNLKKHFLVTSVKGLF
jgi:hypothetical protein